MLLKLPKRRLKETDWFLIIANLLPLYGVWLLNWQAWELFAVYMLETVIVGFFTIIKMMVAAIAQDLEPTMSKKLFGILFFVLFFLIHYGIFVGVQMGLFLGISGIKGQRSISVADFLLHPDQYLSGNAWLMLSTFIIAYSFKELQEFILSGKYKSASLLAVMFEPYGRIFIQQLTVIVGSMFLLFGVGKIFILIFSLIKIYISVVFNYSALVSRSFERKFHQERSNSHS